MIGTIFGYISQLENSLGYMQPCLKTKQQNRGGRSAYANPKHTHASVTAAIQAAWQPADAQLPPLYLESLNNEALCGLVSSAGPSESLHIFVCAVTNGVTHSPTWGIWGLVLFYLQLKKKIRYYRGDKKKYSKVI